MKSVFKQKIKSLFVASLHAVILRPEVYFTNLSKMFRDGCQIFAPLLSLIKVYFLCLWDDLSFSNDQWQDPN